VSVEGALGVSDMVACAVLAGFATLAAVSVTVWAELTVAGAL
jgi:hypothetical protein